MHLTVLWICDRAFDSDSGSKSKKISNTEVSFYCNKQFRGAVVISLSCNPGIEGPNPTEGHYSML